MERVSFNLEFIFKASPTILYKFLTTPNCLIRWFCDEVDITGEVYSYNWNGSLETAILVDDVEAERLRFKWEEADIEEEFLEFRLKKSPVTGDTVLEITDFCDDDEVDEQKQLWETQMENLRRVTGG